MKHRITVTPEGIRCQHVGCKLPAVWRERIASLTGAVYYYYCSKHIGN